MRTARIILSVVFALLAAMFIWITMTVPAFAATAPAVLALIALLVTWVLWPRKQRI